MFSVASFHLKHGETNEAIRLLKKLTQAHPTHVTAWNNLAAVLADDPARLDEASSSIDRAMLAAGYPLAELARYESRDLAASRKGRGRLGVASASTYAAQRQRSTLRLHQSVALRRAVREPNGRGAAQKNSACFKPT